MAIHRVTEPNGEPSTWKLELFANIGSAEEFMQFLTAELPELVDAAVITAVERQQIKEAVLLVSFDGIMPAFERLKEIRASVGKRMPELNRKQLYEAFTIELAGAYKDRMQNSDRLFLGRRMRAIPLSVRG
jgi:hypothetical protein